MAQDAKVAGKIGPLRSPGTDTLVAKGPLRPPTGANTTISGIATKAAPIQSPLDGKREVNKGN
jgi:hypothetical protein